MERQILCMADRFFNSYNCLIVTVELIFRLAAFPFWLDIYHYRRFRSVETVPYIIRGLAFIAYWTYFEHTGCHSLGKMILRQKTVSISGGPVKLSDAVIEEAFGRSFLLPVDLILGGFLLMQKDRGYSIKVVIQS
jgi:hypothetical protein